ncbi:MAG: PEP-CTERM sorting domain-containing protein [Akkermansiaceae bacterium]
MNKKQVIAATAALIAGSASAYTVSVQNFVGADASAVPVIDNAGNPIGVGAGFVGLGTYASAPTDVVSALDLVLFGQGDTTFQSGLGVAGFVTRGRSAPIPEGTPNGPGQPVGDRLYVVFGNGADLASSDQVAVYDSGLNFGTENAAGQGALDVIIDASALTSENLIVGSIATGVDTGLGLAFDEGIQLAGGDVIPEPSTSLLAALAGLGLVARRRR